MSRASDLARGLGARAEAVCRHYLSNGRRQGRYWIVGDVHNTPGRSLFVRLVGPESGPGAAGHWTDAATSEHGDLFDLIRERCGFTCFRDTADEARCFLGRRGTGIGEYDKLVRAPVLTGSSEAARRLITMSRPIRRSLVEIYLRARAIEVIHDEGALRYHPRCYYRPDDGSPTETWPAIVAAVTDSSGAITGAHRTWLAPDGLGKAPIETPRRAMGTLLGCAVRFGVVNHVLAVGEGIETMLSLRMVLPTTPMAAALSANHLAAYSPPPKLRRLYVARDADIAGTLAVAALTERSAAVGIEVVPLSPRLGDFNDDLCAFGPDALLAALLPQLAPQDAIGFIGRKAIGTGCSERRWTAAHKRWNEM